MSAIIKSLGALVAVLLLAVSAFPGRAMATTAAATTCRIGVYFTSVHNVDTAAGTFDADFWMWSVCPTADVKPLETMQFLNAEAVEGQLDSSLPRGKSWWSSRMFSGTFRQDFRLANYPFDHQELVVKLEESVLDTRGLRYAVDTVESGVDESLSTPGWTISDLNLTAGATTRATTFGDPSLPGGKSSYASARIVLKANRAAKASNFIKATFPLFIAAFLALISMAFDVVETETFMGRMGALGSILFAVVLSYVSLDQLVGQHQGLYFLDQIHFAALLLLLLATAWSVPAHRVAGRWVDEDTARLWDLRVTLTLLGLYVIANAVMVFQALRGV
ncbi:MAG: hypothetical protein Q8L23_11935 [Caulobacter sp.]|nr:hypothetical protein [Caulobacter sp.]